MTADNAPCLLVVDDDPAFNRVLVRALAQRGFDTYGATDSEGALELAQDHAPEFIVLDLNIGGESGLKLIRPLLEASPGARILVLTGYASIATAVDAVKLGAIQYLAKPADVDAILKALQAGNVIIDDELNTSPMSIDRLEWEHIQRVLGENDGNISATARTRMERQLPAMMFDGRMRQHQSHAHARRMAAQRRMPRRRHALGRQPGTAVRHLDMQRRVRQPRAHLHRLRGVSGGGIGIGGVVDEVLQPFAQAGVCDDAVQSQLG